ncbi:MAG TPA: putative Ig domain-containing protein [Steroidobacteraceae bacterium]|nr:putative Ig domain-containing protein [Steroidobacteraceae bacterium]
MACVVLIAGCSGVSTQQSEPPPPASLAVSTTSLPNGEVNTAYSATLAATGGTAPYSWTLAAGTLPSGITLDNASGALGGKPDAAVSGMPLTFQVSDASNPAQTSQAQLTLTVVPALTVTTTSLPNGQVGAPYSTTLAATGGTAPYTWALTAGALPAGMTFNNASGALGGTPTAAVTAALLSFTVTDSGAHAHSVPVTLALTVGTTVPPAAPTVTTTTLPGGIVGHAYSTTLAASGGTAPYTWTLSAGTLPAGLQLSGAGTIAGTPTAAATASITVTVTDANAQSGSATLPLTVLKALSVTTPALPNGQVGVAYSAALVATGGTTPYTWTLAQGSALPAGLGLAPGGVVSGTPTATASGALVTVTVTDSGTPQRQSANATLTINVSPASTGVTVTPARAGLTVTQTLTLTATTNDAAGVTWSISPAGGSFSPTSSHSGDNVTFTAPATAGVYTITATGVTDTTRKASITVGVTDLPGVYTAHNDRARDGVNSREYALTKVTVNTASFGKLFSCTVDGAIYAQPLWVANQTIGGRRHNVVYVATGHDSLYAFDADTSPCQELWPHVSLIDTAHGAAAAGETTVPAGTTGYKVGIGLGSLSPEVGVIGTPVIDPATHILYVVSKSMNAAGTSFFQRLHAIDLLTGNEKPGSPVTIAASLPGTFRNGAFEPRPENQRSGLAFANGSVYIVWASYEDAYPWVGWVIAYTYANNTFTQTGKFLAAPNTGRAGIWMSGSAPAVDDAGNVYVITGNGVFDITSSTTPNNDYGDSFLQLSPTLAVNSWFTPTDQDSTGDKDFGAGGSSVVLNTPAGTIKHLVIGGGKDGALYVLNGDHLGGYGDGFAHQMFTVGSGIFDTPAFFNNTMYIAPIGGTMFAFTFNPGSNTFTTTFSSRSSVTFKFPGTTPSVSASGSSNGLVWALDVSQYCTGHAPGCGPAILHALDATDLSSEAWNSAQVTTDAAGNAVKFTVPTIANGKVYVGTRGNNTGGVFGSTTVSGELDVYGLKP